jgi:hypothetical protein
VALTLSKFGHPWHIGYIIVLISERINVLLRERGWEVRKCVEVSQRVAKWRAVILSVLDQTFGVFYRSTAYEELETTWRANLRICGRTDTA